MINIFLLDNHDSFTYNLAAMFSNFKDVKLTISYPENTNIAKINAFDKIIFSPGPGLPNEYLLIAEIIDQYKSQKQFLGVCLGHQAIGEYFGAKLTNYETVNHGMIRKLTITDSGSKLFSGIPDNSEIGVYHSWYIDKSNFPDDLKITGLNEEGIIMAMEHRNYNIQSVQFHPESFISTNGPKMVENWLRLY